MDDKTEAEPKTVLAKYCYQIWGIPGNYSNFVLCRYSMNSVYSAKVI